MLNKKKLKKACLIRKKLKNVPEGHVKINKRGNMIQYYYNGVGVAEDPVYIRKKT